MRRLPLLLLPLILAVAACGSHSSPDAKIRSVIALAYTSTPPQDCTRIFTPGLLREKWGGAEGCRRQMRAIATLNPATVRVIWIHRQGPVADARLRVDDTDETSKLVLTGDQWQVDDTIGPNGSIRQDNNLPAGG